MLAATTDAPDRQHSQKGEGSAPAFRFPAPSPALRVLRPALITKSVSPYESVFFDKAGVFGPDRHDLVNGLITLNALGAMGDEALISVADGSLNDLRVWGYVEAGFNASIEALSLPSSHLLLSPLIAETLPLQSIASYWLAWHDLSPDVIPLQALAEVQAMPEIGTGTPASEALCHRLPTLYARNQGWIASHLTALCETSDNDLANDFPLTFLGETNDASEAPLIVGCGDMVGLNFGRQTSDFSQPYWKAVVHALRLIGLCLRPMTTPDDMIDLSPALMEEEEEDVKSVLALLEERNEQSDDEDAVHAALDDIGPFILECFGSFQCALECYEIAEDVRDRWLAADPVLTVSAFADLVANLPAPSNDMDETVAEWLSSVVAALPASQEDSALHQVRWLAHCESSLDMMLPVFFEDDAGFADASIQPAYEMVMSDAEEICWHLGWDISPALLESFAKGIGIGNKLLSDLDDRITC